MKKSKRLVAFVLCFIILFSSFQSIAFCETNSVKYTNISTNEYLLTISGINSTSYAKMTAARSMSLSIKMELQKLKSGAYSTIETWTSNTTGVVLKMEESRLINLLATYRLKVTFTAGSETIVRYAYP